MYNAMTSKRGWWYSGLAMATMFLSTLPSHALIMEAIV